MGRRPRLPLRPLQPLHGTSVGRRSQGLPGRLRPAHTGRHERRRATARRSAPARRPGRPWTGRTRTRSPGCARCRSVPCPPRAGAEEVTARLGPDLPDGAHGPGRGGRPAGHGLRAGPDRDAVGPVLRLRDRRHPPRRAGRGLAGQRLGPERRAAPAHPGAPRPRRSAERLAARPAGAAGGQRRRVRHRRHDGQLHLPGGRPRRGAAPGRLGRGQPRAGRRARRAGARRRRAARHRRPGAALPRARRARAGRRRRPGPARLGRARRGAGGRRRRADGGRAPGRQRALRRPSTRSREAIAVAHAHGAWVHVDGAFGLFAAASPGVPPPGRRASRTPTRGPPTRTRP